MQAGLPFPGLYYTRISGFGVTNLDEFALLGTPYSSCEGFGLRISSNASDAANLERDIVPLCLGTLFVHDHFFPLTTSDETAAW